MQEGKQLELNVPEPKLSMKHMQEVLGAYNTISVINKGKINWERDGEYHAVVTIEGGSVTSVFTIDLQTAEISLDEESSKGNDEPLPGSGHYTDPESTPLHSTKKVHEIRQNNLQNAVRDIVNKYSKSLIEEG